MVRKACESGKRSINGKDSFRGCNCTRFLNMYPLRAIWPSKQRDGRVPATQEPTVSQAPAIQTHYMEMLLQQDRVPWQYNILAAGFTWLQLAGYVFFPGTFRSLRNSPAIESLTNDSAIATAIYYSVQNVPLLVLGTGCCVVGTSGAVWLWLKWNSNFAWLVGRIFLYENGLILGLKSTDQLGPVS
jgi:hypothetical protein